MRVFLSKRAVRQRGVALLTALLLMLAVLMTGIAAARSAIGSAKIAGHERDRMLALQGAMAGLADAEVDIEGGADPASARAAALASADPAAFADGCRGGAPYEGLCRSADSDEIGAALADADGPWVVLGAFSGLRMPLGGGALAALPPRYLVELMPSGPEAILYRITALGFGSVRTTQVAVQAYYRKLLPAAPPAPEDEQPTGAGLVEPDAPEAPGAPGEPDAPDAPDGSDPSRTGEGANPATPPAAPPAAPGREPPASGPGSPGGPGIRVGWREIGNWQDTMAASRAGERR
jgi:type IV pilus assembly protein PilX